MSKWKDDFRPDGKRWACPYCNKCIEGLFEMGMHLESHKKTTHLEINPKNEELIGYFRKNQNE